MKGICPNCEKETTLEHVQAKEIVEVRGEPVEVETEYSHCTECGMDFENTRGPDSLDMAYRIYRRNHEMLQPEQICEWRKQKGLTQKELSQLLGWGGVTLSRYENGALQVEAHEKMLRLAMEPHNLIKLIEETPTALGKDKRERLLRELHEADDEAYSFERIFEEKFGHYSPNEYSGFRKLDSRKLSNAILFFCAGGQFKTKLNKLLFYADFKHFKEHSVSITGARYVHLQFGPVPDNYDYYFAELHRENILDQVEEIFGNYTAFKCIALKEPDLNAFDTSEREILASVMETFKNFGSGEIMNFSHEEEAYVSTNDGEPISYMHAQSLRI